MRDRSLWVLTLLSSALVAPAIASAGPCVVGRQAPPGGLSRIALEPIGFPHALTGAPAAAIAMWNAGDCNADRFPRFAIGGEGERRLRVRWIAGVSPIPGVCGRFARDEIELFAVALEPARRRPVRCDDRQRVAETLAHELGHALGLLDVSGLACAGHIMAQIRTRPDGSIAPRAVRAAECAAADRRFHTLAERLDPRLPSTWRQEIDATAARLDRLPTPLSAYEVREPWRPRQP